MLKMLFSTYNIDFEQWKALLRTAVRLANRQSSLRFDATSRRDKAMNYSMALSVIVYGFLGLVMVSFVFRIHDLFWSSLIIFTIITFMVGSLMLIEFGTIVIAPEDYHIFSVQPVSSRTYFAAKVSFSMMFIMVYVLALGLPSVVAFGVSSYLHGKGVGAGLLLVASGLGTLLILGITVGMSMIVLYTTIMKHVHFRRLNRALTYLQLSLSFIIYGSYAVLPSLIEQAGVILPKMKPWWIFLLPTSWYTSLFTLMAGSYTASSLAVGVVGLLFSAGVIPIASSKLSMTYAESLAEASTVPEEGTKPERTAPGKIRMLFGRHEDRAIATLIRGQFKNDTRFRLSVLAIIPLTILYILMGVRGGGRLFDPFHPRIEAIGNSALLYFVIILFPMTIKEAVTRSESYLASWIFFVTPAQKAQLVLSVKKILFSFFVVPYVLVLGFVFLYFFESVLHVLMHILVLLLFSYAYLQVYLLVNPQMPFSVPRQVNERATFLGMVMFIGPALSICVLLVFSFFIYQNTVLYTVSVAALVLFTTSMEKLLVRRVSKKLSRLEFRG